jgi:hypothetical protein
MHKSVQNLFGVTKNTHTNKDEHTRTDGRTDILSPAFFLKYELLCHFFVGYNHSTGEGTQTATAITYQLRSAYKYSTHTSSPALTVKTKRLFNVTKPSPVSATSLVVTWSMNRSTCHINTQGVPFTNECIRSYARNSAGGYRYLIIAAYSSFLVFQTVQMKRGKYFGN